MGRKFKIKISRSGHLCNTDPKKLLNQFESIIPVFSRLKNVINFICGHLTYLPKLYSSWYWYRSLRFSKYSLLSQFSLNNGLKDKSSPLKNDGLTYIILSTGSKLHSLSLTSDRFKYQWSIASCVMRHSKPLKPHI